MSGRLADVAPDLERMLTRGAATAPRFAVSEIRCETVWIVMRDGVRLATDVYLPPHTPAPVIAVRTPYGRGAMDRLVGAFFYFARRGYVVVCQDCRGTGDSEPESWDYAVYEREDSFDFVEWITNQPWFDGFLGSCGGSYLAQTQWCMAMHPRMSSIVPEVGGLGVAFRTARKHMFYHAYARSVGKGADKVPVSYRELEREMLEETLSSGYFNEPLSQANRCLWQHYCTLGPAQRAELIKRVTGEKNLTIVSIEALSGIFGQEIAHDAYMFAADPPTAACHALHAPALMITGWYDWSVNDALATWELLRREASGRVRADSRLIITPSAHNMPGYKEGMADHPELQRNLSTSNTVDLLLRWYEAVRGGTTEPWPAVMYYLMGANEWRVATDWPPPEAQPQAFYLGPAGTLSREAPTHASAPDRYTYDPSDPTPTVGGSIVSYVYPPGSVDVSGVQKRADVLTYMTAPLERDLVVAGPLRLILYASSSAVDTDFSARLSDVFPDGRAIQLQAGILRARYREPRNPGLLEPGRIYRFEIDLWATANCFKAGHRLCVDIASADFPRFDRNANRGGEPGPPVAAQQTLYHDPEHPSHLLVCVSA
jgi:predicted acyl esterase